MGTNVVKKVQKENWALQSWPKVTCLNFIHRFQWEYITTNQSFYDSNTFKKFKYSSFGLSEAVDGQMISHLWYKGVNYVKLYFITIRNVNSIYCNYNLYTYSVYIKTKEWVYAWNFRIKLFWTKFFDYSNWRKEKFKKIQLNLEKKDLAKGHKTKRMRQTVTSFE